MCSHRCDDVDEVAVLRASSVYKSDLKLLKVPCWFNDNLLNFAFTYMQFHEFENEDIEFVDPRAAFIVTHGDDEDLDCTLGNLDINQKKILLLPVNNNVSVQSSGGSHWSLLAFDIRRNVAVHADSSENLNENIACQLASKLGSFFKSKWTVANRTAFIALPCARQANSYDCGAFVIVYARHIARFFIKTGVLPSAIDDALKADSIAYEAQQQIREQLARWIQESSLSYN